MSGRVGVFLFWVVLSFLWVLPASAQPIRLGVGAFTEQLILGELSAQLLHRHHLPVETRFGLAPEVLRHSLEEGRLDLYWEYTGLALVLYQRDPDRDLLRLPGAGYEAVKAKDAENDLIWGDPSGANNTYGLLMTSSRADELGLKAISDLAVEAIEPSSSIAAPGQGLRGPRPIMPRWIRLGPDGYLAQNPTWALGPDLTSLILAMPDEFKIRPDGYQALAALYGLGYQKEQLLVRAEEQLFSLLVTGQADIIIAPLLDSRLIALDLVALAEDEPFFPAYVPAPLWRGETARAHPEAYDLINRLARTLDNQALNGLLYAVEIIQAPLADVAADWLEENGLVPAAPAD